MKPKKNGKEKLIQTLEEVFLKFNNSKHLQIKSLNQLMSSQDKRLVDQVLSKSSIKKQISQKLMEFYQRKQI